MRKHVNRANVIKYITIATIVVAAFLLRVFEVDWNPNNMIFQPDDAKMVLPTMSMAENHTIYNTFDYVYPNQGVSAIVAIVFMIRDAILGVADSYIVYYSIYRVIVSIFGALTIIPAFYIGERIWEKAGGYILALLTSLYPMFVCYSKQCTNDITAMFFQVCVVALSLKWIDCKKNKYLVLMGLSCTLAVLEKYHCGTICIYAAVVVFVFSFGKWIDFLKRGSIVLGSFILGIILFAPNMLIHFNEAYEAFKTPIRHTVSDGKLHNWSVLILDMYAYCGVIAVILTVLGIMYAVIKHEKEHIALVAGMIHYLFLNLIMGWILNRWGMFFYFGCLTCITLGLRYIFEILKRKNYDRIICASLLCLLALTFFVHDAYHEFSARYGKTRDTRIASEVWLLEKNANVFNTVNGGYTAFSPGGMRTTGAVLPFCNFNYQRAVAKEGSIAYVVRENIMGDEMKYLVLSELSASGYEPIDREPLMVFESSHNDLFWSSGEGCGGIWDNEFNVIYKAIKKIIDIRKSQYIGPSIYIYDISDGQWEVSE